MSKESLIENSGPIVWAPQKGSQALVLACPISELLNDGTRGSMKTDTLLMDFAQHVGQGFGAAWRGILFRQSYPQLAEIVVRSKKWFNQIFPGAVYNKNEHIWTWPTGEQLLFRYMDSPDDYWNYHGHQYPWIGWEEITQWPDNECYESMKTCCRSSTPGMPRKYRANCNPYGVGHGWVKKYFVDPAPAGTIIYDDEGKARVRIHSNIDENKILLEADPEYLPTLDGIKDPNKKKAWRRGQWDITAGGAIDDVWDETKHVLPYFNIPSSWHVDRSFDWGSSKPFSVGWWAESDGTEVMIRQKGVLVTRSFPPGTLFRIGEMYGWNGEENKGSRMIATEIARRIKDIEEKLPFVVYPGPADNTIYDVEDGKCIADDMAAIGVTWTRSNKNPGSRINGLERFRQLLYASLQSPMEDPGFFVCDNCIHFKRTVPVLPRDKKKMDDVDTQTEDHCYDETRYRASEVSYDEGTISIVGH